MFTVYEVLDADTSGEEEGKRKEQRNNKQTQCVEEGARDNRNRKVYALKVPRKCPLVRLANVDIRQGRDERNTSNGWQIGCFSLQQSSYGP
jgi:hypothetical protein